MNIINHIVTCFPYLPLLALLTVALPKRVMGWWAFIVTLLISAGAILSALQTLTGFGMGILKLDGVSAIFALMIGLVSPAAVLYGIGYLKPYLEKRGRAQMMLHFTALVTMVGAMVMVVAATEKTAFLFWWELMTLASFVLVLFDAARKEVFHAAIGYLVLMHVGFFCLVAGFFITGLQTPLWEQGTPVWIWALFLVGFGLKAGIFPLHAWLPVAHPAAPAHVSALMSGVMIKMGIYGIIRTTFACQSLTLCGYLLLAAGAVTAIFGIAKAASQKDLKRMMAYSSIENIGIIVLALGVGVLGKSLGNMPLALAGIGGALIHVCAHGFYKSLLFFSAGALVQKIHTSSLSQMGGLLKRMPVTGALFFLAVCAICALPPLGAFFSELTILSGLLRGVASGTAVLESLVGIVVLATVAGLTLLTFMKGFSTSMLGTPRTPAAAGVSEVSSVMIVAMALPLTGIVVGVPMMMQLILSNAAAIFGVSATVGPLLDPLPVILAVGWGVVALTGGLVLLRKRLQKGRAVTAGPTWGCGFTEPNPNIQYSPSSFSAELEVTLRGHGTPSPLTTGNVYPTASHKVVKKSSDSLARLTTSLPSRLMHRLTSRLALFQTGRTNHYVLHALLFIILILALSMLGWL